MSRRSFLRMASILSAFGAVSSNVVAAYAERFIEMPFANGRRRLERFPQKRELIVLRTRPPLLETPFAVFDQGVFTPNDAFYVRWHLSEIPTEVDVDSFRLRIRGNVKQPLELTLQELVSNFPRVQIAAVNQCAGNGRGFFKPRVPGGEWGNGAMGNALWTGVPLKALLDRAGVRAGSVAVRFNGLDKGVRAATPDFMKSLSVEHAADGEVMVAYAMNGEPLPMLNGFPIRLVVPGWYATYWVKALNDIEVLDHPDDNFWMTKAYLVPDTPYGNVSPDQKGVKFVPIGPMVVRSFITNLQDGAKVRAGATVKVRGIAFGGNASVSEVMFSYDGGASWQRAEMGKDYGKYSFRRWEARFSPPRPGQYVLMSRARNSNGAVQPITPNWNPGGYMRAAVESVKVIAA